jgi:uncharacterized protein (DUF433 family)
MDLTSANKHIDVREGVYYVLGTRVSLDSIIYAFREGSSPESIHEDFEGLTLADVFAAIAFYLDNQTDIEGYLLRRKDQWAELERRGTPANPELQERLEGARRSAPFPRQ